MSRRWALLAALFVCAPALADDAPPAKQDEGGPAASTQAELDKMDQGADTIDVSAYPKEQQDNYLVFAGKCSKCHTLARPINSPFALHDEWQAYVTKMSHKPRSGIDEDSAAKIIDFLTFDSSLRKKDIIAQKQKGQKDKKDGASAPAPAPAADSKPDSK